MTASRNMLPYGSWPSPITSALVAGKSLRLAQPRIDGDSIFWTETRPAEQGRTVLVRWRENEGCVDITPPPFSVQSKVHEYGGGAYTTHGKRAWFVNRNDQRIHETDSLDARPVTAQGERFFADLVFDPHRERLLAVCEDHRHGNEPETSLVAIALSSGEITTLASGSDFYSSPRLSPRGTGLAWLEWNHPDMPWDSTRLKLARLDNDGGLHDIECISETGESCVQPLWRNEDELLFASDCSNWWNIHAWKNGKRRILHAMDAEFALPHWVFGMQCFGLRDEDRLACAWTQDGQWRLGEIALDENRWRDIATPWTQIEHLHAANGRVVVHAASAALPARIALLDESDEPRDVRRAAETDLDPAFLAPPQAVEFNTGNGERAYGLYYAPAHPDYVGEPGSAPPMLVKVHGGPTAATSSALDMKIRFWTSRGFAVLDVNYRGSTGYGRDYRKKLYGNWGIADVEDCIKGALELAARGMADSSRLLISGSSAGGFTALAALTFHDTFAAGASYYGVADLAGAMRDTAKFESRYGDQLVGPLPQTEATWRARSPLFNASRLKRPVIFFQGLEDRVVPPDQSERMFEAARANGVRTEYLPFPTEGHGFRQAATIEAALDAEYRFYCEVLGLTAAESQAANAGGQAS